MKSIPSTLVRFTLAAVLVAVSAGAASAYDHDKTGWYDEHHVHHKFTHHKGHRGYWDHDKSGARIFITV